MGFVDLGVRITWVEDRSHRSQLPIERRGEIAIPAVFAQEGIYAVVPFHVQPHPPPFRIA